MHFLYLEHYYLKMKFSKSRMVRAIIIPTFGGFPVTFYFKSQNRYEVVLIIYIKQLFRYTAYCTVISKFDMKFVILTNFSTNHSWYFRSKPADVCLMYCISKNICYLDGRFVQLCPLVRYVGQHLAHVIHIYSTGA